MIIVQIKVLPFAMHEVRQPQIYPLKDFQWQDQLAAGAVWAVPRRKGGRIGERLRDGEK